MAPHRTEVPLLLINHPMKHQPGTEHLKITIWICLVLLLMLGSINCTADVWTLDGERVQPRTISTLPGSDHCGWETTTLLHIGSPLGSVLESGADVHRYVRDPEGVYTILSDRIRTTYAHDTQLPPNAKYSGYKKGGVELWIDDTELDSAIYMVEGSIVERWPKADPIILCD